MKNQSNRRIKRWRTDHDIEVENKKIQKYCQRWDIAWELSISYAHEQNDDVERQNRTVIEKIIIILNDAELSYYLWDEVFVISIYLKNRTSSKRLTLRDIKKTSFEIWFKQKLNLEQLRIIECNVWYHLFKKLSSHKKLSDRAVKCKLLRYENINQYKLYNSTTHRLFMSRNVIFDEMSLLELSTMIIKHFWNDIEFDEVESIYENNDVEIDASHENDSDNDKQRLTESLRANSNQKDENYFSKNKNAGNDSNDENNNMSEISDEEFQENELHITDELDLKLFSR